MVRNKGHWLYTINGSDQMKYSCNLRALLSVFRNEAGESLTSRADFEYIFKRIVFGNIKIEIDQIPSDRFSVFAIIEVD